MSLHVLLEELVEQGAEFWADSGRLRYRAPENVLTQEILSKLKLNKAQILEWTQNHAGREKEIPLSHGQKALWFIHQNAEDSAAYHISVASRICSPVDTAAMKRSLEIITRHHPLLRAFFSEKDGKPVQIIRKESTVNFSTTDASSWSKEKLKQEVTQAYQQPFDLKREPLLRFHLFSSAAQEHVMLITIHHIIFDGWSLWLFMDKLQGIYSAVSTGKSPVTPLLQKNYENWIQQQQKMLSGQQGEQLWQYWQQQLGGEPPLLQLPTDRPRPSLQTYQGASCSFQLDIDLSRQIKQMAKGENVTLFTFLLAAFQVLLYRYTGQDEIWVGSPVSGREQMEFEHVIGCFVNMMVLRANCKNNPDFKSFLVQVKRTVLDAMAHQDYPFPLLVERLKPKRHSGHSPLFQVDFMLQKAQVGDINESFIAMDTEHAINWGSLIVKPFPLPQQEGQFDLTLEMLESQDNIFGAFKYNTDLFNKGRIQRMIEHFKQLLKGIVQDRQHPISLLPFLTEAELQQLEGWNTTKTEYQKDLTIPDLFEKQVEKNPENIAVIFENQQLSYLELNRKANQLAHYLMSLGVGLGTLVGIYMERSLEMMIGLLGILKAGAAYVPLDPIYPKVRIEMILGDAKVPVILSEQALSNNIPAQSNTEIICMDKEWNNISNPEVFSLSKSVIRDNLCYVIYTSGSTGKSKGVEVLHRGLTNFLESMSNKPGIGQKDVLLAVTTISFDIAALELYLPLINGGTVVIASKEQAFDGIELKQLIRDHNVTIMQATPATWSMLIESGWEGKKDMKVLCGGEALTNKLAIELKSRSASLWNMYGPTETTIWSAVYKVEDHLEDIKTDLPVSIGGPIANTEIYILDDFLQPVPTGVPGQIYIAGHGLAKGYHDLKEMTSEKFVENPFTDNTLMYRTGDLGYYLPDGNIIFLGRKDNQVKIRGFRIELGEIEAALMRHKNVKLAVVNPMGDDKKLVAYWIPEGPLDDEHINRLNNIDFKEYLREKLPEYMVPSVLMTVDKFQLTPNNKIDRLSLPEPEGLRQRPEHTFMAVGTSMEVEIVNVWKDVLKEDGLGIHDNFFDIGGNSLLLTQIRSRLGKVLDRQLKMVELLQHPTIHSLSQYLDKQKPGQDKTNIGRGRKRNVKVAARYREREKRQKKNRTQLLKDEQLNKLI
ncbi:MAG: amino acid adenylation domain-containing protein [Colwellia sp.]|nr:amino acid adenylation domain-containing protein [Colwellia sp.]